MMPRSAQDDTTSAREAAPPKRSSLDAKKRQVGQQVLQQQLLRWEAEHRDRLREHPIPAQELRITY